jgi:hypothetical protein
MHRLIEDVIMEFLPPGIEGGMSYGCGHKRPGIDSRTTHIMENPAAVHKLFDFLSGFWNSCRNSLGGIWPHPSCLAITLG